MFVYKITYIEDGYDIEFTLEESGKLSKLMIHFLSLNIECDGECDGVNFDDINKITIDEIGVLS